MTTHINEVFVCDEIRISDSVDYLFLGLIIIQTPSQDESANDPSLTKHEINSFRCLYMDHYGIALTEEQATDKGIRLVRMLETTLKATAKKSRMTQDG